MARAPKKLKCRICDKKFVQSDLKRHVKEVHEGIKNHPCEICGQKFGRSGDLKCHVKTVHEGIKEHQCQFCEKKFGQLGHLKTHVKRVHVHDGVDQSQSLKRKKQVDNTQERSKNVTNSKRMKKLEKEALDVSNIVGFDYENAGKEQKIKKEIKQEIKTEPVDENITEGNVNVEPIDKNSKRIKMMEKQALDVSNITGFDHIEEQKIKKEIKTEVKIEPIDENVDEEIEKQALDYSNITGFDHENQIEEQKIKKEVKQEVKIEPPCVKISTNKRIL